MGEKQCLTSHFAPDTTATATHMVDTVDTDTVVSTVATVPVHMAATEATAGMEPPLRHLRTAMDTHTPHPLIQDTTHIRAPTPGMEPPLRHLRTPNLRTAMDTHILALPDMLDTMAAMALATAVCMALVLAMDGMATATHMVEHTPAMAMATHTIRLLPMATYILYICGTQTL